MSRKRRGMEKGITQEMIDDFQSDLWQSKMNRIEDRGQAEYLLKLGYRKADEVRKETVSKIRCFVENHTLLSGDVQELLRYLDEVDE